MPIGIAANSRPSATPPPRGSPNTVSAISGNTTRGMPKPIAITSTRNDTSRTLCSAAYRTPSTTLRSPATRDAPGSGGTGGSRHVAHSVASSAIASNR